MRKLGLLLAGVALAVSVAQASPALAGPAGTGEATQQAGRVTLFQNDNLTGPSTQFSYTDCQGSSFPTGLPFVSSFENDPPLGCQVSLVQANTSFVLCDGRGRVPLEFRRASLVRVGPGFTLSCFGVGDANPAA